MQQFYKRALVALIFLLVVDAFFAAFCISQSYVSLPVLAARRDGTYWRYSGVTDSDRGGRSTIRIGDPDGERLRFDFRVVESPAYPYAAAELLLFDKNERLAQIDWSKYETATFLAKCQPASSLMFVISAFDDKMSKIGDFLSYRTPQSFFSCTKKGVLVSVDLHRLIIPEWWFTFHKIPMALDEYKLNKVTKVAFGASIQALRNVDTHVEISEFTLHCRDYRFIVGLVVFLVVGWSAFGIWFFLGHARALTASVNSKLKKDLPLVAYRQLTLEPYKDKERESVVRFVATNYTDVDLDLEAVVLATGVNRNKINVFLKAELGMTFTGYLNKLRLTEAARLLSEKSGATISEIAYSVGYGNVPYFNKLFKEEYGCTPKAFRSLPIEQE